MDTTRGIACRVGWHRWQVAVEDEMQVGTCTRCGRRRYHGAAPGTKAPEANWGMNYTGGGGLGGDGS
jgi:hypothetical protein